MSSLSYSTQFRVAAKALGHYMEQREVLKGAQYLSAGIGLVGGLGILGADVLQAKDPDSKKKIAIRDLLMLAVLPVSFWVSHKAMPMHIAPTQSLEKVVSYLRSFTAKTAAARPGYKTLRQYFQIVKELTQTEQTSGRLLVEKFFPAPKSEGFKEHWGELKGFLAAGITPILAGVGAGLAADAINEEPGKNTVKILRETSFQVFSNVILCTLGTLAGIAAVDNGIKPIRNAALRLGIIGTGLSAGLVVGSAVANSINQRFLPDPGQPKNHRQIEVSDTILHLDDAALIGVISGVSMIKAFLPLFFGFSAYRAGIGYDNSPKAASPPPHFTPQPVIQQPQKAVFSPLFASQAQNFSAHPPQIRWQSSKPFQTQGYLQPHFSRQG